VKTRFVAAALLLFAVSAPAQTIYSKVDPDGHSTFSDLPITAAESEPESVVPRTPVGIMRNGSRRAAVVNANEAERRLAHAQLQRRLGIAPLAGDRVQGSATRMNYHYWRRQEKLRLDVERAQQRVNATRPGQLARH
jgi:hypothetical protein